MEHKLVFIPAFDRTDSDPKKNYGVGCLELRFLVIGDKGATEFQLITNWYLPHVMNRRYKALREDFALRKPEFLIRNFNEPNPVDLCYYSKERLSEDDCFFEQVKVLDGEPYWYGYKYRDENGNDVKDLAFRLLVSHGDDALYQFLEAYYKEVFGEE